MLLASALKSLLRTTPLDKVTISDVVKNCGVSRRAFYYHFDDIYEATIWMFEQDLGSVTTSPDFPWNINVAELLKYIEDNKFMCVNILRSSQGYRIEELFFKKLKNCIESYLLSLCEKNSITPETMNLISDCYTVSMLAIIKRWITGNISCSKQELLSLFEKTIGSSVAAVFESLSSCD